MTLGEGKRKVLMLLDEYSSGGEITQDEDIMLKMNDFFDIAQRDIAQRQPIIRRTELTLSGDGSDELPEDVGRVLKVKKNGVRAPRYEIIDGWIIYNEGDTSTITLDYIAAPKRITRETEDGYSFEVSEEAANCMPFFVAAQQLIADLVVDYGAFYNVYLQMRNMLPRSTGLAGGEFRQALYRG